MKKKYNPNDEIATNYSEKDIQNPYIGSYSDPEHITTEPNYKTPDISHEIVTSDIYAVVYKPNEQTNDKPSIDPMNITRDSFDDPLYDNPYDLCMDSEQEIQYTDG